MTKTRMSLQQVLRCTIEQNNMGVEMLAAGNSAGAIAPLSVALKAYKRIALKTYKRSMNVANPSSSQPVGTSLDQCMAQSHHRRADILLHEQGDIEHFLYRQAIRIPPTMGLESTHRATIMGSSIVIFNLALAHQLTAMEEGNNLREMMLHQALKFYELGFNIVQQKEYADEPSTMYILAAVNNSGLAHQHLNDRHTATKCFKHLMSTLMYLIDCGEGDSNNWDFEGFLRNATEVDLQAACPAAAA
jgi:hypothetical protein